VPSNIAGYLTPTSSQGQPGGLSLEDFIQTIIVGISGYAGTVVRPKFQQNPPKQPSINTDWIAFAIQNVIPDANAYTWLNDQNIDQLTRMEKLEIQIAYYGPNSLENISVLRDGFQIQQNLEAMRAAGMGFNGLTQAIRGPDLLNERWVNRWEMTLTLVRQVLRVYPVLSFASAAGSIHTVVADEDITLNWEVEEPTP
jgi:hypothetical protein